MKRLLFFVFFISTYLLTEAQQLKLLAAGKPTSLRGLSVVNDFVIWVSGSQGTIGLSTDAGKNWKWMRVTGFEKTDFRDIEAFNENEAIIMGITEPAVILRTKDGGNSWKTVFVDSSKSAFLDAMDFHGDLAIAIGDPVLGKKYLLLSENRGTSWHPNRLPDFDSTAPGEAYFAASGSNVRVLPSGGFVRVSGGKQSRLLFDSNSYVLLINQGTETTGANSIAIDPEDPNKAFIVGGDFSHDTLRYRNSLQIKFHPFIQTQPIQPPHGYRSCVEYLNDKKLICCGTSGVDISYDGGKNWKLISNRSFHVCRKAKYGSSLYLAGPNGSIAQLKF